MDDRYLIVQTHRSTIDLGEKVDQFLVPAQLWVIPFDLARGDFRQAFCFDAIDNRGEDPVTDPEPLPNGNPDNLALLILALFVTEPDRRGLPALPERIGEQRGVEVQGVHSNLPPRISISVSITTQPATT
jgi:hypothetical protein